MKYLSTLAFFVWIFTVFCLAQAPAASSLDPTLEKAINAFKVAAQQAQNYTYEERDLNQEYDSHNQVSHRSTETYEIVYLEGAPYKRHTLHNDQPLSEKDQQAQEKEEADVARTRRKLNQKHGLLNAKFVFKFPFDQLATAFVVTPAGSDIVNGRPALVFKAVPTSTSPDALKESAHNGTAYEMKIWVDQQDPFITRVEAKVLAEGMRYKKDSIIGMDWKKLNDEAWLPARFHFQGSVRYMLTDIKVDDDDTYSNYHKFQASSTVIP